MDQDLYTTHFLFEQYVDSLKSLKHLILFYSIHSQGHELAKTKSFKTMALHHAIFGVPYPVKEISKWKRAVQRRFKTFNDADIDYKNFTGYVLDKRKVVAPSAEFRVLHHLRENRRPIKQNNHLFEILKTCIKKGIKPLVVIAPTRSDFVEELEKSKISDNELFGDIFNWCKKNKIPVLNELRSKCYDYDDFLDSAHLNPKGASKLTKKIAQFIKD